MYYIIMVSCQCVSMVTEVARCHAGRWREWWLCCVVRSPGPMHCGLCVCVCVCVRVCKNHIHSLHVHVHVYTISHTLC